MANNLQEINIEEPKEKEPTKVEQKSFKEKMESFNDKMFSKGIDIYMILELFTFVLSFFFLIGDNKTDFDTSGFELEVNSDALPHKSWCFYFNGFLMIDFFFRMLSLKIPSMKRQYWNHTLHCVFPLAMWMLAAYYTFDDVFASEATGTLNILLFIGMNLGVILVIILKFVSLDKLKNCFKKKKEENNMQNDLENNNNEPR